MRTDTLSKKSQSLSFSVVIPVYNEERDLASSLCQIFKALEKCKEPWDLIVVDDGSTDDTASILAALQGKFPLSVVSTINQGRFLARQAGFNASSADIVVLIDCGLNLDPDAFLFLETAMMKPGADMVWNAHVDISDTSGWGGSFWRTITTMTWPDYIRNPREMSFTLAEFDAYPKGTTMFAAPRTYLIEACGKMLSESRSSLKYASDDTAMIRLIAEAAGSIHLSPQFACSYTPRDTPREFLKHATFRGTTFIDGYLGSTGTFGRRLRHGLILALAFFSIWLVLVFKLSYWALAVPLVLLVLLIPAAFLSSFKVTKNAKDCLRFACIVPFFASAFTLGAVRGLYLYYFSGSSQSIAG
jgi:hypothetical protein